MTDQPAPTPNDQPALWDVVIARMHERDQVGLERYGTRLQPFNGRHFGEDAMAEVLDLAVYLEGMIVEFNASQRQNAAMRQLLERLVQWDHLDGSHDGPYWRDEIKRVLSLT